MARPNYQGTKISHGHEWEPLRPLNEPVDPTRIKKVLHSARRGEVGQLHRLYERMDATDDRFGGNVSKLKRSIASNRVRISPSARAQTAEEEATAQEYAEHLRHLMRDLSMRKVLKAFTKPYLKGAEVYEIEYEKKDAPIMGGRPYFPTGVSTPPTRRLRMGQGVELDWGKLGIYYLDGSIRDIDSYRDTKVFKLEDEEMRGRYHEAGVARRCLTWWIIKQFVIRWWGEYADLYGEPVRVAEVDSLSMSEDKEANLQHALESLGQNGWAIIPDDIALEMKDMTATGGGSTSGSDIYQAIIAAANIAYTVSILGQTDTTEGGEGAYAKAKIQNLVRLDILEDVASTAEEGLEHVGKSALRINLGNSFKPHLAPKFKIPIPNPAELSTKAEAFKTLTKKMGVPVAEQQLRDEFGLDSPTEDQVIIANGQRFGNMAEYLDFAEKNRESRMKAMKQGAEGGAKSGSGPDEGQPQGEGETPENSGQEPPESGSDNGGDNGEEEATIEGPLDNTQILDLVRPN